ncbi:SRPBCC family protein [Saccharomonospora sp.]|uniref:SRPBCC family protein n=1 Tax=Saccharomonospora sp. TaxID=33913 RepID=UPI002620D4A1|nr:SRPBCC family protein [Saccharomonospora sp.]
MTDFEQTRVIDAKPEVVFDIASSMSSLESWTPEGVDVEHTGDGTLHAWVSSGSEVRDEYGYVDTDRERLRLQWGGTDTGYEGWLQAEPHGAKGDSTLATLHVSFSGDQPETLGGEYSEEVDRKIEEALDRLSMLVNDRAGEKR